MYNEPTLKNNAKGKDMTTTIPANAASLPHNVESYLKAQTITKFFTESSVNDLFTHNPSDTAQQKAELVFMAIKESCDPATVIGILDIIDEEYEHAEPEYFAEVISDEYWRLKTITLECLRLMQQA